MTGPENWHNPIDPTPEDAKKGELEVSPDMLLLQKINALKDRLEYHKDPDYEEDCFEFEVGDSFDTVIFPESVADLIVNGYELTTIVVKCSHLGGAPQTEILFDIIFALEHEERDEEKVLTVVRHPGYSYHSDQYDTLAKIVLDSDDGSEYEGEIDDTVEDPTEKVPAISPVEFNRFLGSLIHKTPREFSIFDAFEWEYNQLMRMLTSSRPSSTTGKNVFLLDTPNGGFSGELSYNVRDDKATDFRLLQILHNEIVGTDNQYLAAQVLVDNSDKPASQWSLLDTHPFPDEQPEGSPIPPSDNGEMIQFIEQHIRALDPKIPGNPTPTQL